MGAREYKPKEKQRRYSAAAATCKNAAVDNSLIGKIGPKERAVLHEASKIMSSLHTQGVLERREEKV